MNYILISFVAGLLTVFAPCVFTLLPVILGGTLSASGTRRTLTITASLSASVIIFTLVLKASTALINVPPEFWNVVSGGIILGLGIVTLFPELWGQLTVRLGVETKSQEFLQTANGKNGVVRDVLTGAALGPVFSSCSPTYALILATVLPQDFAGGFIDLVVYAIGMGLMLLLISLLGQKLIQRLQWAVDPKGLFRRILGILFVVIGILIITGIDRQLETYLLDNGYLDITKIEINLLNDMHGDSATTTSSVSGAPVLSVKKPYDPPALNGSNWLNSAPLSFAELKGKVVLIDFWTYSCINCIRTLPYVKQWNEKYKDQGLVIIGVHTPEFAFEKIPDNVAKFLKDNGITYPVVQDNDYAIWNGFNNQYWPAEYFINRDGKVVHTHFGEGEYDKTEMVIQYLLGQTSFSSDLGNVEVPVKADQSPETYLNYQRGSGFANVAEFKADTTVDYMGASTLRPDNWSLQGKWLLGPDDTTAKADGVSLKYQFSAKEVYLVMGSDQPAKVKVMLNGQPVSAENKGSDVDSDGYVTVSTPQLYRLIKLSQFTKNQTLELIFPQGVVVNTFTFGG